MRKIAFSFTIVVLLVQTAAASNLNPYGKRVDACCFRLCQAATSHNDAVTSTIERARKSWILHRFERPVSIKLKRLNQQGLVIKLRYANEGYQAFCADGKFILGREIPIVSELEGILVGDVPIPLAIANQPPFRLGKAAAALGCDVFYQDGKPVLLTKHFRHDMTENQRKLATRETLAHDLGQPDWSLTSAEVAVNYVYALADIRSELDKLPWFARDDREWYDWREFPMSIQRRISNAVGLYWKAEEWQFLSEVATHII